MADTQMTMYDPEVGSVFCRGQVWYWEDPIYGSKLPGKNVAIGEGILRYNRYVVIVQTEETMSDQLVLVVPCSSRLRYPSDVEIPVSHVFAEGTTYARCQMICPAHKSYLKRYVCTLPDSTMACIDAELVKIMMPAVTTAFNNAAIKQIFGLDLEAKNTVRFPNRSKILDSNIRQFCASRIQKVESTNSTISIFDMKKEFDLWCDKKGVTECVDDIAEFVHRTIRILWSREVSPGRVHVILESTLATGELRQVELVDEDINAYPEEYDEPEDPIQDDGEMYTVQEDESEPVNTDTQSMETEEPKPANDPATGKWPRVTPNRAGQKPRGFWTDERMAEFLQSSLKHANMKDLAAEWGISESSAKTYYRKFALKLEILGPGEDNLLIPERIRDVIGEESRPLTQSEDSSENADDTQVETNNDPWSTEKKIQFMLDWSNLSAEDAADKHMMAKSTAKSLSAKFIQDSDVIEGILKDHSWPPVPTKIKLENIDRAASKYSNLIRNYLLSHKDEVSISPRNSSSGFFKKVCSTIYYSIITYLRINVDDTMHVRIPEINEETDDLRTWHFLSALQNDPDIYNPSDTIDDVKDKYKYKYGLDGGISQSWLKILRGKLNRNARVYGPALDKLIGCITVAAVRVM